MKKDILGKGGYLIQLSYLLVSLHTQLGEGGAIWATAHLLDYSLTNIWYW